MSDRPENHTMARSFEAKIEAGGSAAGVPPLTRYTLRNGVLGENLYKDPKGEYCEWAEVEAALREIEAERERDDMTESALKVSIRYADAQAALTRLRTAVTALTDEVLVLKRHHTYCEDCWYSCPQAEDGCCNEAEGADCNCGADEHNAKVEAVAARLRDALKD